MVPSPDSQVLTGGSGGHPPENCERNVDTFLAISPSIIVQFSKFKYSVAGENVLYQAHLVRPTLCYYVGSIYAADVHDNVSLHSLLIGALHIQ